MITFRAKKENVSNILSASHRKVMEMLKTGDVEISIMRPSKSRDQEKKYHAIIGDIARTVSFDGIKFSYDVWKAKLVDDFEKEKKEIGSPLSNPGSVEISLDGLRLITIRPTTTKFRVSEASEFIEYLYAKGIEYGANFTDKSMSFYEEIINSKGSL